MACPGACRVHAAVTFLVADREEERYDKEADILGKGGCGLVLVKDRTGCLYVSLCLLALGLGRRGSYFACDMYCTVLTFFIPDIACAVHRC
jgi:hypothetical protein